MNTAPTTSSPTCMQAALAIVGDKWTGLLLSQLTECPKTFGELEESLSGISPRTLSQRLEKLCAHDITNKLIYCEHPPRYRYSLTPKGTDLKKVLRSLSEWGAKYG